jgi:hypothetical protein
MTPKEIIQVVSAFEEGKEIQFRGHGCPWVTEPSPVWNFFLYEYRVKPEPFECWVKLKDGCIYSIIQEAPSASYREDAAFNGCTIHHMREVL